MWICCPRQIGEEAVIGIEPPPCWKRTRIPIQPDLLNWNGSGKPRDGREGLPACCIAGFPTRARWNSSTRSESSRPCRLGSRRYSRFGNLRYQAPWFHLGIRAELATKRHQRHKRRGKVQNPASFAGHLVKQSAFDPSDSDPLSLCLLCLFVAA